MKKKNLFTMILMSLLLVLAACGNSDVETEVEGASSSSNDNAVEYPTKSLSAIAPWPAGSGSDIAFRGYIDYLSKELDENINVKNSTGGNGGVGWAEASAAPADGYNMSLLTFDVLTNEALGVSTVSYKDFDIINLFTLQGMLLITHADYDFKDLEGFLAAAKEAKANGKTLTIGTNGDFGLWHQAGALMAEVTDTEDAYNFVPLDGSSEQVSELLGKHLDAIIVSPTPAIGHIEDGKLIGLGTLTDERLPTLPDVPTFKEKGHEVKYESFRAWAVPKGTDEDILKVLREAGKKAYDNEDFQKWAAETNVDPYYMGYEETNTYLEELYPVVQKVIEKFDIK